MFPKNIHAKVIVTNHNSNSALQFQSCIFLIINKSGSNDKDCHKFPPSSFHYLNSVKYLFLFASLKCSLHFVQLEFFSSSTCGHLGVFTFFFVVMAVLYIIYCTTDFTSIFFMNLFLLSFHNLFAFPLFHVIFFCLLLLSILLAVYAATWPQS